MESGCFKVSFDETLNDMTQSCEMDLLVKYADNTESKVMMHNFSDMELCQIFKNSSMVS